MAGRAHEGAGLAAPEQADEPVVLAGAEGRLGGRPLVGAVEVLAVRIAEMNAERLNDRAGAVVEQRAAFDVRRAERHQLGGKAHGHAHRLVAQHGPADILAFLQRVGNQFDHLLVRQLVGERMALRFLPGLGRLVHGGVEVAAIDRLEMAGPQQGDADVAGRDGVHGRRAVPPVLEDARLSHGRAAGQRQDRGGQRQAAQRAKVYKEGRHDDPPAPSSSMRAARPTTRLYQKRMADQELGARHCARSNLRPKWRAMVFRTA